MFDKGYCLGFPMRVKRFYKGYQKGSYKARSSRGSYNGYNGPTRRCSIRNTLSGTVRAVCIGKGSYKGSIGAPSTIRVLSEEA